MVDGVTIKYADRRGGLALPVSSHAESLAASCRRSVALRTKSDQSVESVIAPLIEVALREAFDAGTRFGQSEAEAKLEDVLRARVERAIAGLATEPARCPHCHGGRTDYGSCEPCNGTGKRQPR